jgi:hypothetical protein
MGSAIGRDKHCAAAFGVHGWISKRQALTYWSLSIKSYAMYKYLTKGPVMSKIILRLADER